MKSEFLSNRELRIFKHQIDWPSIGILGQESLKKSKVLVVGAGGKGSAVLQHLAAAGVGLIGICDNQIVEETVLPRQTLYGQSDLGKQKAIISKQKIAENHPLSRIEIHNIYLADANILKITSDYDIIVDATDNFSSHSIIDKAASQEKKPVVLGIVGSDIVMVSVLNFKENRSFHQLFSSDSEYYSITNHPPDLAGEVSIYGMAGNLMAREVLKIILNHIDILDGKVMKFNLSASQIRIDVF